ncbi:MAG TPA: carboxylating nicotinate-nucleotide diphosphorylase [Streptosporangiales bacterium]
MTITTTELDVEDIRRVVRTALAEDLRLGPDVTTEATVPADARVTARLTPRRDGTLAGLPVVDAVLAEVIGDAGYELSPAAVDGGRIAAGTPVAGIAAPTRGLLTAERTLLNLVGHLSGVATATAAWVDAVRGTGCAIRDTRKTLPGLRALEKYAVRCGGGVNHRLGLGDAFLVKDNHVAAAGSIAAAVAAVRAHAAELSCEVEVDSLEQLDQAVALGVELVLLDNMTVEQCAEAVRRVAGTGTRLEVSGGLTLDRARAYAETGVDYLSVGALTHSAPALDIGLDL